MFCKDCGVFDGEGKGNNLFLLISLLGFYTIRLEVRKIPSYLINNYVQFTASCGFWVGDIWRGHHIGIRDYDYIVEMQINNKNVA